MEDNQGQLQLYIQNYLKDISVIAQDLDTEQIEKIVDGLVTVRKNKGRIFCIGVGGGAANASHAVNDFRKLCRIEAYSPTDNVAELTARTNNEGWETVFEEWLDVNHINMFDIIFIFSVEGGTRKVSYNIYKAVNYFIPTNIYGIVGSHNGQTKIRGENVIVIPTKDNITAYTESFQIILLHCIVFHPKLLINQSK